MKENKNVPEIRFEGFEGEWEDNQFNNVAIYRNGRAHENDIEERGKYIVVNSKFVSTNGEVKKYSNKQNEPLYLGEIAFVLSDVPNGRAIARTFLVDANNKYTLNQRIAAITPTEETDSYFLYILLNRNKYFLQFDDGAKQTNLSKVDVENFLSYYPSKPEQSQIGTFFQNLDNQITLEQQKHDKLVTLKKAMLEKMFPKEGASVPEIRFEGFENKWNLKKLSELTNYKNGVGNENNQSDSGKYELINLNSISINGGLKHSGKYIDETESTLCENDLVMILSDVGHGDLLGRVAIIPENDKYVLNQRVALLRPNNSINPKFLFYNINANQYYFKLQGAGMSQLNISRSSVENFMSYIPIIIIEQSKIGSYFQNLDKLISLQQQKIDKLKNIKKACLDKMFV